MRFTEKTEIAIRVMKVLEKGTSIQFTALLPLLENEGVSHCEDTVRSVIGLLVKRGLVVSTRGRMGGYVYFGPSQLSVWEIICAVESEMTIKHSYVVTILKKHLRTIFVQDFVDSNCVSLLTSVV